MNVGEIRQNLRGAAATAVAEYCRDRCRISKRYCGVCDDHWYCVPFFGSTQKDGDVWKLPDSEIRILFATSAG